MEDCSEAPRASSSLFSHEQSGFGNGTFEIHA